MDKLPIFTKNQQKGNQSATVLKSILQKFCIINEIGQEQDIGIDFTGIVLRDNKPSDLCFNIQCKGTEDIESKRLSSSLEYSYPIKIETINYWKQKKDVTFLFLVDATVNKAYWVDVIEYLKGKDISNQNSVTIHIPQNQVISFDTKEMPNDFIFSVIRYYSNFAPYVNEQLKSIQKSIENLDVGKNLIEILDILNKNIIEVNNTYKETIQKILDKIEYDFGKSLYYAHKLDQMDDIVRIYCVNGIFNDSSMGYDGKSLKVIIQEVNDLRNMEIDKIDDLEKLLMLSHKIEEVEGNIMGFYREMAYEDCPMGDHSEIENDFGMYLARRIK
ncbi:MAG: DUF4365 domain-containing protein [Lachnospiraceae bacterium]|nr:DUF4365 domain-containing protein [Lachnospiraceae bacterium]